MDNFQQYLQQMRQYLQQNEIAGVTLHTVLIWLFLVAAALLVILLLVKLARRMFSGSNSKQSVADNIPPQNRESHQPPASVTSEEAGTSKTSKPFGSILHDESTANDPTAPLAPAVDSIFHDERDEMDQPEAATEQVIEPAPAYESRTNPPPTVVASSPEAHHYGGKQRSWTSRSLFGKPMAGTQQELPRIEPGDIPFADRSDYAFGGGAPALAAMLPESDSRKTQVKKELIEAGHYNPHAYENFAAWRYVWLILPILFFGVLLLIVPPAVEWIVLIMLVVGILVGWALPRLFLRSEAAARRREIEQSLPDVIDLLNMCVSQGMTLRSGLGRVAWEIDDTYPAMAEELRIVTQQADLSTVEHALSNLNERVDVPELHSLTSLLIQTERMGTNVSDSLTEYSDGMRATLQQRADQKANASTFKLLFPTVLCLMPAVYLFLLGPAVVELSDFFQGDGLDNLNQNQRQVQDVDFFGE